MKPQIIHHPSGESLVVMTLKDYETLRDLADDSEDWQDLATYHESMREIEFGQDQIMPEGVVKHFFAGNSLLKSIRMWRDKTQAEVAEAAGIGQGYLSELECKEKKGTDETLARIAAALDVPASWLV